jgi:hypothetical protein
MLAPPPYTPTALVYTHYADETVDFGKEQYAAVVQFPAGSNPKVLDLSVEGVGEEAFETSVWSIGR